MATYPKYPPEPARGPQPVAVLQEARQERRFKLMLAAVGVVIAAVVILVAVWLLKYGGGAPQEQPKPRTTAAPSGVFIPVLSRF